MESHYSDTMEFVKNPHLQDCIYDSNVTVEVLPRNLVPSETMTWDIKHMLDNEIL
jgi:hypothetical protein